jgi:LysM repeat protein
MSTAKEDKDYYVVKDGDTLEGIAARFLGVGLSPLLSQLNGVTSETLRPGMRLWLHPEYDD